MNVTIARITARALFGRRRFLLLIPLPLLLIGLPLLAESLGADPEHWSEPVIVGLGLAVVLPVIALVVGTGVLGSEIDDGTLAHILAKPLSRAEIIFSKYVVAVAVTALTAGVPLFVTGLLAGSTSLAVGLLVGAAVGSLAYCALFLLLSLLTRRPVLLGLIYILVWEGLLGNLLTGTRVLSVTHYVQAVADRIAQSSLLDTTVTLPVAVAMAFIVTVGATVLAVDRLRSFTVVGDTS